MIHKSTFSPRQVAAACALLLLGACGALESPTMAELDSNTNWLRTCDAESPCPGALSCLCGICSHPCGTTAECSLLPGAECGAASCGGATAFGGMCVLSCSTDAECSGSTVCEAGRCIAPPVPVLSPEPPDTEPQAPDTPLAAPWPFSEDFEPCEGGSVSIDAIQGWMRDDLASMEASSRRYQRYVSLTDSHNAAVCGRELDDERAALTLTLNSVSTRSALARPTPIDPRNLIYRVDLRDYGWERPVTVGEAPFADGWEALMASLGVFAVEFAGPEADTVKAEAQAARPLVASGALVHALLAEPQYSTLLGIPEQESAFYQQLGVDVAANRETGVARRAGVSGSTVATRVRLLERHPLSERPRALWLALAMAETQDPFTEPLQTTAAETHVAFSLPNGLLGFALFDAQGRRGTKSETLLDTHQDDSAARSGVSCIRCHSGSVVRTTGEVRPFVLENVAAFDNATVQTVERLYAPQAELEALFTEDGDVAATVFSGLGLDILRGDGSTINVIAHRHEGSMWPARLAAELWTSLDELRERAPELALVLRSGAVERVHLRPVHAETLCIAMSGGRNRPQGCP